MRIRAVPIAFAMLLAPAGALAQGGPIKSGVRGRVVIAAEMLNAKLWPMDEELAEDLRAGARVRRPSGRSAEAPLLAPKPKLVITLEGVKAKDPPAPETLKLAGMRFAPGQVLLLRGQTLTLTNDHQRPLTVDVEKGESLGTIEPGKSKEVQLQEGVHQLRVREMPFARAVVRVLSKALILPVSDAGEITATAIEGGEYQITFYHGARALQSQTLSVPDDRYVAIDASVSTLGVVTVSIKDGGLQVALPPPEPAPRPKTKAAPPPAPPKESSP